MKKQISLVCMMLFLANTSILAWEADDVLGTWLSEEKDAKIEIFKTGKKYYGKLVWLDEPFEVDGTPKIDDENPDPDLRNRRLMGLQILNDFTFDKDDDEWENGTIYDPDSGNTYKAYIWFEDHKNTLNLRGYIGFSIIGRTSAWTRVK